MSNRMRLTMLAVSWLVFLTFIALSSFANWEHGTTRISSFMLAVVPVGFAASIFLLEGIVSAGRATKTTYAVIGFVALCAGVASYLGLFGMARDSDIPIVQAALLPLAFDGVVGVASMAIRAFGHAEKEIPLVPIEEILPALAKLEEELAEEEFRQIEEPPVSAPVSAPPAIEETPRKERAPRSSWDAEKVIDMLLREEKVGDIVSATGIGRSTLGRYSAALRQLKEMPRGAIDPKHRIPEGHAARMRELVSK